MDAVRNRGVQRIPFAQKPWRRRQVRTIRQGHREVRPEMIPGRPFIFDPLGTLDLAPGPVAKRPRLSDSEDDCDEHVDGSTITWRMDPKESLSDWTVIVTNSPGGSSSATYHVHKSFLSVGRAKCDYFTRLFQKRDDDNEGCKFSEFSDCTSRFNFDQKKAVDSFPDFLDYIYTSDSKTSSCNKYITTANAVAIYYLAEYLGCRHLRRFVRRFLEENLNKDTIMTYYIDAKEFQNERFINEIVKYCAFNDVNADIVSVTDYAFWLSVLNKSGISFNPYRSQQNSLLIASFCVRNYKDLNLDMFKQLTSKCKLPVIHYQAAIQLMAVEHTIMKVNSNNKQVLASSECVSSSSCLEKRCKDALVGHCSEVDLDNVEESLNWVDSKILFRLLKLFQKDIK